MTPTPTPTDNLDVLESEAIHIFREVAGEFDRPVILFSGGKDSTLLVHLAVKAFWPAPVPFPLLHVDTGHNFPEVLAFRDKTVTDHNLRLVVTKVQDYLDDGRLTERPDGTRNPLQITPLLDAITDNRYDAVFGGGRRDEERARAKERIFSLRNPFGQWEPRRQRPELWNLYNGRHAPGEHVRVFPLSNWTELDVWRYIARENIDLPSIYYTHQRDVFLRDGMWLTTGPWGGPRDTETTLRKAVRYRTVGDGSCTGAIESTAATVTDVITEVAASRLTERGATRADDRLSEAAMEDRKREGYFWIMTDLLRLATAGSVDDGKSTLVGRLLYDTKSVLADQLDAIHQASTNRGLTTPDLSLLVDGLRSEREQGITIDVAYRYFATPTRSFVLADTPGHVQYTRNTVTGASTAQLAILLIDARKGIVEQTRRHAAVLALLGVPQLILAANKMDLVGYDEATFEVIAKEFRAYATALGYQPDSLHAVPISALNGDNVVEPSDNMSWYTGPTLLEHLETVPVATDPQHTSFRFPVQYVIREQNYRGYAGQVAAGSITEGEYVTVLPSGLRGRVRRIDTADGRLPGAVTGQSVTLLLDEDLDIGRGDLITGVFAVPTETDRIDGTLCWLSDRPLRAGARVRVKHGTRTVPAIAVRLRSRFDEQSLSSVADPHLLRLNEIGRVLLRTSEPLPVDDYTAIRQTGAFLVIEPGSGDTLAAGLVGAPLPLPDGEP